MRILFWCLSFGIVGALSGCGEFVRTDAQTSVNGPDVIGDDDNAKVSRSIQADVYGSGVLPADNSDLMVESNDPTGDPRIPPDADATALSVSETNEPDVSGTTESAPSEPVRSTNRKTSGVQ